MKDAGNVILPSLLALAFCLAGVTSAVAQPRVPANIRYVYKDGGSFNDFAWEFTGTVAWVSDIIPSRLGKGDFGYATVAELRNCSDAAHLCVIGQHIVFAVPREGLTPLSNYIAGGAYLRVEKCLLEQDGRCDRAMISSDCRWFLEPDGCTEVPAGASAGDVDRELGYFIFDRDKGVTSFGTTVEPTTKARRQMSIAQHFKLQGSKGLLATGVVLPLHSTPHVAVVDDPANRRFNVRLEWQEPVGFCIDEESWPTAQGQIVNAVYVRLQSDLGAKGPVEVSGGYCAPECFSQLAPGTVREGFVNYSAFGDPDRIRSLSSRELVIQPAIFPCSQPGKLPGSATLPPPGSTRP